MVLLALVLTTRHRTQTEFGTAVLLLLPVLIAVETAVATAAFVGFVGNHAACSSLPDNVYIYVNQYSMHWLIYTYEATRFSVLRANLGIARLIVISTTSCTH
jgi:hypothetical protein